MNPLARHLLVLLALSISALSVRGGPPPATSPVERPDFSLATFNINYGNSDLSRIAATIRAADADVVALQETNAESAAVLRRELVRAYPVMLFRGGRYPAGGFGFLSRTPLRNPRVLPPGEGMFGGWSVEADLGGRTLQLVNVHLQPARLEPGMSLAALMRVHEQTEVIHAAEIARVERALSPTLPAVVLGDFNSLRGFAAPRRLLARGLRDSGEPAADAAETPTWHFRDDAGHARIDLRIDYLFHASALQAISYRVFPCDASDHDLVAAGFRWLREDGATTQPAAETRPSPRG